MEQFSWLQIIGTLFGAGFIGGSLIPLLNFITAQVKERQARRELQAAAHTSSTVESRRLDAEDDERNRIEAQRISDFYKMQWEKSEEKNRAQERGNSLSHSTVTRFYVALRSLRKEIDTLDLMNNRGESGDKMLRQIEIVKQKWEEVDKIL